MGVQVGEVAGRGGGVHNKVPALMGARNRSAFGEDVGGRFHRGAHPSSGGARRLPPWGPASGERPRPRCGE